MQKEKENMVQHEYPAPDEVKKDSDTNEMMQTEETGDDEEINHSMDEEHSDDEEINHSMNEEHSDDICGYFGDVYPDADVSIDMRALEDELNHLQTVLDHLERKNDDIHAQLTELLQSNREVRKQFQESVQTEEQQPK